MKKVRIDKTHLSHRAVTRPHVDWDYEIHCNKVTVPKYNNFTAKPFVFSPLFLFVCLFYFIDATPETGRLFQFCKVSSHVLPHELNDISLTLNIFPFPCYDHRAAMKMSKHTDKFKCHAMCCSFSIAIFMEMAPRTATNPFKNVNFNKVKYEEHERWHFYICISIR